MSSLINLPKKSNSCFDRYKLAQKGAEIIPMGYHWFVIVRLPTPK